VDDVERRAETFEADAASASGWPVSSAASTATRVLRRSTLGAGSAFSTAASRRKRSTIASSGPMLGIGGEEPADAALERGDQRVESSAPRRRPPRSARRASVEAPVSASITTNARAISGAGAPLSRIVR
jgi:hypothetical protein